MNLETFLRGYPSVLFSPDGDSRFETLRLLTRGHSSAKEGKLLNYASSLLSENECYLEIGTYTGYSLCSAGLESIQPFIGFDNFSEPYAPPDQVKAELKSHLDRYLRNYLFTEGDFRSFDLNTILDKKTIGVFYVDGKHTYEDVIDSINWARPFLSKEALIVFDDVNVDEVRDAINEILKMAAFREVFYAKSFFDSKPSCGMRTDPFIHNGFSLVSYRGEA